MTEMEALLEEMKKRADTLFELRKAEDRIFALKAENAVMRKCLTDIRDNYDCDSCRDGDDAHCRCCKADAALSYKFVSFKNMEEGEK